MNAFRQFGRRSAATALFALSSLAGTGLAAAQEQVGSSGSDGSGGSTVMLATGAVFALVGFGFASSTVRQRRRAGEAAKWPTASAEVISSEVVEETSRDSDGHLETHYMPRVWYSYEAGGQSHKSDRIRFASLYYGTHRKAAKKAAEYPAGRTIQVRYDPADPASATIETVKPSALTIVFGGIFMLLGAGILLGSLA
jgi:hypothetical protein